MKISVVSLNASLAPAIKALKPKREDFEKFVASFKTYCGRIDSSESEENLKTHLMDFLKPSFFPDHLIEQQERIDFVIRIAGKNSPAAVLFEAKRHANKTDMISASDCNRKAMHELVLYYKLTLGQRQEAIARREAGESPAAIARSFGVSRTTIKRLTSQA
jgi:adenine-specific DNA-methyltransferase